MNTLMYLVYGDGESYWRKASYSLLTALGQQGSAVGMRVVVVTDQAHLVQGWPVEVLPFDGALFSSWVGPLGYGHRSKNRAMAAVMDAHPEAKVCLVDADTLFLDRPERLFERVGPGQALMHASEGRLVDAHVDTLERLIEGGIPPAELAQAEMRNSGIVGLDPSDRALLDEALERVDALYAASRVFNMEQLGLGEVLASRTRLRMGEDVVLHYYGPRRPFFELGIERFFAAYGDLPFEERARAAVRAVPAVPPVRPGIRLRALRGRVLGGWSAPFHRGIEALLMARGDEGPESRAWEQRALELLRSAVVGRRLPAARQVPADLRRLLLEVEARHPSEQEVCAGLREHFG